MVERVAGVVLLERLAGTAGGDTVYFGADHIADVGDIADDSHCSSDSEKPETAAATEQPWQVYRTYKLCIKLIDQSRFQKKLAILS